MGRRIVDSVQFRLVVLESNTSLAAKGALAHRLQRLQNPKWPLGDPKMANGVWKDVYPKFLDAPVNFR